MDDSALGDIRSRGPADLDPRNRPRERLSLSLSGREQRDTDRGEMKTGVLVKRRKRKKKEAAETNAGLSTQL